MDALYLPLSKEAIKDGRVLTVSTYSVLKDKFSSDIVQTLIKTVRKSSATEILELEIARDWVELWKKTNKSPQDAKNKISFYLMIIIN